MEESGDGAAEARSRIAPMRMESVEESADGARVRRRRVRVREVPFQPGLFQVDEGLAEGELIATTGIRQLREGSPVEIRAGGAS